MVPSSPSSCTEGGEVWGTKGAMVDWQNEAGVG